MQMIGMAAILAVASPATAVIQDERSDQQRIADASAYGAMIYAFDRAAWVSTDSLLEDVPRDQLTGAGGYVIEPLDRDTLRATYFKGQATTARAFFVADVRGGKVVRHQILAKPEPLTPAQMILARAREIASTTAETQGYRPCTPAPFNTVVIPSADSGPVTVYLLTPQVTNDSYMMGGNYRIVIAPDGKIVSTRAFSLSCLNLPKPDVKKDGKEAGLFITHLMDPVPTEIHIFASYSLASPVFVLTKDKSFWIVQGNRISPGQRPK